MVPAAAGSVVHLPNSISKRVATRLLLPAKSTQLAAGKSTLTKTGLVDGVIGQVYVAPPSAVEQAATVPEVITKSVLTKPVTTSPNDTVTENGLFKVGFDSVDVMTGCDETGSNTYENELVVPKVLPPPTVYVLTPAAMEMRMVLLAAGVLELNLILKKPVATLVLMVSKYVPPAIVTMVAGLNEVSCSPKLILMTIGETLVGFSVPGSTVMVGLVDAAAVRSSSKRDNQIKSMLEDMLYRLAMIRCSFIDLCNT